MRNFLIVSILFFFLFLSTVAIGQPIIQSNCNSTPELISKFRVNAFRLAARIINERQKDTLLIPVELDSLLVDSIFNALMAIHNSGLGEADTIFQGTKGGGATIVLYPSTKALGIWGNKSDQLKEIPFYDSLYFKGKAVSSGNTFLDSFFNDYSFIVSDTFSSGGDYKRRYLRLTTSKNLNLASVKKAINSLNIDTTKGRVTAYNGESYIGRDYQNLTLSHKRDSGFDEFEFFVGWNDCPSGCQNWRTWKFRTYDGCKVQYLGATGNYVGIKYMSQNLGYTVYPNPSSNTYTINGEVEKIKEISVFDLSGKALKTNYSVAIDNKSVTVNTDNLASGVYLLHIYQEKSNQVIRVIKH